MLSINYNLEFEEKDKQRLLSILKPEHKLSDELILQNKTYKEMVAWNLIYVNNRAYGEDFINMKLKEYTQEEWDEFNRLNNEYCLLEIEDNKFFVPKNIQLFLINNGWYKTIDRVEKDKFSEDGYRGRHKWIKKDGYNIQLNIHYSPDKKHECVLWMNSVLVTKCKIGNLKAALKRRFK